MSLIRDARFRDAEAGVALISASIRALCGADHGDDPAALADWLQNKTPEHFRAWLADPGQSLMAAQAPDGRLLGVGLVTDEGEVRLLYAAPDAVRSGVGAALLDALERRAHMRGAAHTFLRSTRTALGFYARRGYVTTGADPLALAKPARP